MDFRACRTECLVNGWPSASTDVSGRIAWRRFAGVLSVVRGWKVQLPVRPADFAPGRPHSQLGVLDWLLLCIFLAALLRMGALGAPAVSAERLGCQPPGLERAN